MDGESVMEHIFINQDDHQELDGCAGGRCTNTCRGDCCTTNKTWLGYVDISDNNL